MRHFFWLGCLAVTAVAAVDPLEKARDQQDRGQLDQLIKSLADAAQKQPQNAAAQYRLALAQSYLAEVAIEVRDKNQAKTAAEAGMDAAKKAIALQPDQAAHHRVLGTLCGQVIPANVLAGIKYGRCAQEEVNRALQLDPKSADNYLARGVGNYYLPPQFGGGVELAIKDFEKAIQLNPKLAEAQLWLGVALRKANRNAEARKAFQKSLELNPNRAWAKQQLDKTPSQ
jgi:tetratricopeptide (TPR) repeat protein